MELDALVRCVSLTIEPPSLSDTASDWERVTRALQSQLDDRPLEPTLAALRDLGPALRRGEWHVAVTLADAGEAWRVVRVGPAGAATHPLGLAIDLGTTTAATSRGSTPASAHSATMCSFTVSSAAWRSAASPPGFSACIIREVTSAPNWRCAL